MKQNFATKSAATLISLVAVVAAQAPLEALGQAAPAQSPSQSSPTQAPSSPQSSTSQSTTTNSTTTQTSSSKTTTTKKTAVVVTAKKSSKRSAPVPPPKPPKPPWQEFKLDPKTTMQLDFSDSNPDMILTMFAHTSGITIVKDPSLKTPLTVQSAKSVHLDEAFSILNTVLKLNGYELQKEDNLLVAGKKGAAAPPPGPPPQMGPPQPPPAPAEPKSVVKFYALQYASAATVARVINEVFSQQQLESIVQQLQQGGGFQGGQPQFGRPGGAAPPKVVRASSEDYSNTVIVNAPEANQIDVEALIKKIDISTDTPLDSEIFHLKYVTVDEVVDAVKDVLTSNAPVGRGGAKQQDNNNNQFFYYNPYRQNNSTSAGGQSAIAVKQTNSIIVSATKANMEIVKKLLDDLDNESSYVGTTSVIHLENAKATDVATLLNTAFTKRKDQNSDQNPYFFIYSDNPDQGKKSDVTTDMDENGRIVNVRDLTGKVNIVAEPNTNSLVVVTLPSNLKLIRKVIDAIDVVAAQVMIEMIIVEANLDKTTKLGVEWNFSQNSVLGSNTTTAAGSTNFGLQSSTTPLQGFSYTLSAANYKAFVNALETNNRYKILDTPRIFTTNNVAAKIDVSQQYPYTLNTSTSTLASGLIATTSFLPIGVVLKVTPRIAASGEVSMDVDQTADDLQGLSAAGAPIVNHREAQSTVTVEDGQTILLGGIISSNLTINESKIPILGDIPLLGKLFTSSSRENTQTELMVFMTPHIVKAGPDAIKIRQIGEAEMSKSSRVSLDQTIQQGQIKH
jgi:general secretion pathway protein D